MIDYDVVQIGFGPVGQTHAALLGDRGHRVGVFERWPSLYPLARAGHVDHEIMRIFQSIGAAEQVEREAIPIADYDWFNGDGELLLHVDWANPAPSGWKSDYLMYQPRMEDAIRAAVAARPSVEVNLGWEAAAITQHDDHVEVLVREGRTLTGGVWEPTGRTRTITARYLVGADGANSAVRRGTDIAMVDYGFEEDWLVLDVRPHDPDMHIDMPEAAQICDPRRPVSLFRWLGREHARWEFMLLPGETAEQVTTNDAAWGFLAPWGLNADNTEITRRAVYTFRSLLADRFRDGRVVLIGDSAHVMPPFMGQGMCSGVRDAANLAWKLDLVLRGLSDDRLLDSYTEERRPHVDQIITTSIALGQIVCISDPVAAGERDAAFRSGQAPPPPPFPGLTAGILGPDDDPTVGSLGVQGRVAVDDRVGRADDLLGAGWYVLSPDRALLDGIEPDQRATLDAIGARVVHVTRSRRGPTDAIDIDATYHVWFRDAGVRALVVRPDYYVYGTASDSAGLNALLGRLPAQLGLRTAVQPA